MTKPEELANWLLTGEVEELDLFEAAQMLLDQEAEIKSLKKELSVKVILNEHAQQSMKMVKDLLK